MHFLLDCTFLVNNAFIYSFKKLLSKYHVFGTMLGVLDKEITKTGMSPGFYGVHGLVGKAILNGSYTSAMKRSAFGNIWQQEIRWSGDPGEGFLRKFCLC